MKSINPANEQLIKEYQTEPHAVVVAKLESLQDAFSRWKAVSLAQRTAVVLRLAAILTQNKDEYVSLITAEMGKLKKQALQEVEKCAKLCQYYADNASTFLAPKTIKTEATKSYVAFTPLGIILGVMPWNFPFWQVFRFAVPALLAGNVAMLKHASSVPGCALALEKIFLQAVGELDLQIFKTVLISGEQVSGVIAEPLVQAVSLTGSVAAGKSVASVAGSYLKKTVLELGGCDPYIVLADADIKQAVTACATSRLNNCGQSCIAAKRFIVVAEVYDQFLSLLTEHFAKLKIGDPNDAATDLGPLSSKQIFDTVTEQVAGTIAAGAHCHFGGEKINNPGYYFQPTILTNIPNGSPGYSDEIFGPVACVFKVADQQEAIALANDTIFGLGAAIFSKDLAKATQLAEAQIEAGSVFVNAFVASDPRLPFGGVKQSGYGRELSEFGIHEFVNIKTIQCF